MGEYRPEHEETSFSAPELQDVPEREQHRTEYQLLRGRTNRQGDEGETDENFRARYVELTDQLIHKIEQNEAETVVFLDKSARPVEWLVSELWDDFARDDNDEPKPKPDFKFVNIDRDQWRHIVGSLETGTIDINQVPQDRIDELRRIFADPADPDKSLFDGKKVMIVDEVMTTGDTLAIAKAMFARAFPEANFSSAWWMVPRQVTKMREGTANTELPVWYAETTTSGRGVDNRDARYSATSPSRRQREGANFLSTPYHESNPGYNAAQPLSADNKDFRYIPDASSAQLRAEVRQLGHDLRIVPGSNDERHRQYVIPGPRDYEFYTRHFKVRRLTKQ